MMGFVAIWLVVAGAIGLAFGYEHGQKTLCSTQFKGEMHDGKCVKVQREELK